MHAETARLRREKGRFRYHGNWKIDKLKNVIFENEDLK